MIFNLHASAQRERITEQTKSTHHRLDLTTTSCLSLLHKYLDTSTQEHTTHTHNIQTLTGTAKMTVYYIFCGGQGTGGEEGGRKKIIVWGPY